MFEYNFCLYIRARTIKAQDVITKDKVPEHVLKTIQQFSSNILLTTPPSQICTQLSTNSIYINNQTLNPNHQRYTANLKLSDKGTITGNLWFTSDTPYSNIKRKNDFKRMILTNTCKQTQHQHTY
jgi:hypothetical protein